MPKLEPDLSSKVITSTHNASGCKQTAVVVLVYCSVVIIIESIKCINTGVEMDEWVRTKFDSNIYKQTDVLVNGL